MSASYTVVSSKTSRLSDRLVFLLLAGLFLFAPIVRGGNRQVAMAALLAFGLSLLAVIFARLSFNWLPSGATEGIRSSSRAASRPQPVWWWLLIGLVAFSPIWLPLLQLIPIDAKLWAGLSGHQAYLEALASTGRGLPQKLPLSLHPDATWAAMWSALPLTAVFLAVFALRHDAIEKLLGLLILAAVVQAVLGLLQLVQGGQSFFYFASKFPGGINGTFNNRNHLADMLAMLIPVWFYFLLRQKKDGNSHSSNSSWMTHAALLPLWMFLGFALMVVILTTQSRGGLFAGMIVMVASAFVYMAYLGSRITFRQRLGMLALLAVFGVAALASVGVEGIGARLQGDRLKTDADVRGGYTERTFEAAAAHWPWGTGVGSYESVFPRYQALESTGYVTYAHNDYPQLLMELGAPVLLIAAALAVLVIHQAVRLFRGRRRGADRRSFAIPIRWFCGLGALALLLHSQVEFNMHIPALAIIATFLLGSFLRPLRSDDADG